MAPLVLTEAGSRHIQVIVGAAEESGTRAVGVYSRDHQPDSSWLLHAQGVLTVGGVCSPVPLAECRCGRRWVLGLSISLMGISGWRGWVISMVRCFRD